MRVSHEKDSAWPWGVLAASFAIAGDPALGTPHGRLRPAAKCEACHRDSAGNAAMSRLEGQLVPYLATRIRSFADLTVQNPHAYFMFDINASLSDATVIALAKYISAQPAVEAAGKGPLAAKGEHLYRFGEGADIGACQGCHGVNAEGGRTVPRLASASAQPICASKLEDFSMFTRVHDAMNMHARRITEDQITMLWLLSWREIWGPDFQSERVRLIQRKEFLAWAAHA